MPSPLWCGWALAGPKHRAFYSGDSAMFPGFGQIGERLGPFGATMVESGACNQAWADVHLGPEQAVLAHLAVKGVLLLPTHWATYNLAMHGWTEPAERRQSPRTRGCRFAAVSPSCWTKGSRPRTRPMPARLWVSLAKWKTQPASRASRYTRRKASSWAPGRSPVLRDGKAPVV